jgi:hypothetical protein
MDKPQKKARFSKKRTILILAAIFFICAFVLPWLWPDASTQYTGIKKEVADYAVKNAWEGHSGTNYATIAGTIKISVENIIPDDPNNKMCNGEFISPTDPESGDHFLVTVGYHTIFGIPRGTETFHICRDLFPSN